MRTFVQTREHPQKPVSSSLARPNLTTSKPAHREHPLLHLQRTIGNQAARLLEAQMSNVEGDSATTGIARVGHEFSRIPIGAKAPSRIQTELTVNTPRDAYEQEADRIADQVTATPAHSAVSGAPTRIQRFSGHPNGQVDVAPNSVDQTLAGPGRPLDPALRQDMELRFGHDFSRVRVHSGAVAEQSARDVSASAYTVGHNVVFGAGRFTPGTREGRRLIAHELTHVVQQSRSQMPFTTAARPGLVQRQKVDAKQAARAKVEEAMKNLKAKFGLAEVSEEKGATWSESELAKVDAAFSKVGKEDKPLLKDLYLIRTDKFEPVVRKGKTFKIAGTTYGISTIRLAKEAFQGNASTILHEVGHLIQNRVAAKMLDKSKANFDLEASRYMMAESQKKAPTRGGRELQAFVVSLSHVTTAASDLLRSGEDDRAAKQSVLDDAKLHADLARPEVEQLKNDDVAKAWLEVHDRQQVWVEAVEKYLAEKGKKNLTGFIEVVTKNNLARKGYVPFTDYVAAHWPSQPEEYFAQAFHTWRTDPNYMKRHMNPLFIWFEKGGHREGKGYFESKGTLETVREVAPVMYELGREVKETFWPQAFQDPFPGNQ